MVYNAQMIRFRPHIFIYKVYFTKGHFCHPLSPLRKGKEDEAPLRPPPPFSGVPDFIFHRMKMFLLLHEKKHSLFVLYNTKIGYCFSNKNNLLNDHRPRNILTDGIYWKQKECNSKKRIVLLHSGECNSIFLLPSWEIELSIRHRVTKINQLHDLNLTRYYIISR